MVDGNVKSGRHGVAGRASWGVADQAVSSLTNFGLGLMVARSVTPKAFGAFGIAFASYALVVNIGNGMISEPFLVRFSNAAIEDWRRAAAAASGAAISVGLVAGAACLAFGLSSYGALAQSLLALALTLPGLVLQDTWRSLFFATRRGGMSFANDLLWAVTLGVALAVVIGTGHATVFWLVLAWGGSANVAAAFGALQARTWPNPLRSLQWCREQRDLAVRFVGELLTLSGGQFLAIYTIGAIAGLVVVGGIRGAEMLLGPIYVMNFGVRAMAVPEAAASLRRSAAVMQRRLIILAGILTTAALVIGTVASMLPDRVGVALLGKSWEGARPAILPMALWMAATGASISGRVGLRALAAASRSLRARLYTAPLIVVGAAAGAAIGGTRAAALGMALGMVPDVVSTWWQLHLAVKEHLASTPGPVADDLVQVRSPVVTTEEDRT
ncbi:MAG: hypothetical protein QOG43_2514 [Actinomycetota bacterium]|jgi:hypothetical protein|nr:hypothetical protein [Actinomycetota bacterium]